MHFPIISISTEKHPVENWDINPPYNDSTLYYFTDYYGDLYSGKERMEAISSDWFKMLFEGFADVDSEKGEIRVFPIEKVKLTLKEYIRQVYEDFNDELTSLDDDTQPLGSFFYEMRNKGQFYKGFWSIFLVDGYTYTSMQFIEDMVYYAGKTLYIENIFDAHV